MENKLEDSLNETFKNCQAAILVNVKKYDHSTNENDECRNHFENMFRNDKLLILDQPISTLTYPPQLPKQTPKPQLSHRMYIILHNNVCLHHSLS